MMHSDAEHRLISFTATGQPAEQPADRELTDEEVNKLPLFERIEERLKRIGKMLGGMKDDDKKVVEQKADDRAREQERKEPVAIDDPSLKDKKSDALEQGTRLKDKQGRLWEKNAENRWEVKEGSDNKGRVLSNEEMDSFRKDGKFPERTIDDARLEDAVKDAPKGFKELLLTIMKILKELVTFFKNDTVKTQAEIDQVRGDIRQRRGAIDAELATPGLPPDRRQTLITQRGDLDRQDRTLRQQETATSQHCGRAADAMNTYCRQAGLGCRAYPEPALCRIRIMGDRQQIRQLQAIFEGTPHLGWAYVGADSDPRNINAIYIPVTHETLCILESLCLVPRGPEAVESPNWETVIRYPRGDRAEFIIVSYPPGLVEGAMGVRGSGRREASFTIRNWRDGDMFPPGGPTNVQRMPTRERTGALNGTASDYEEMRVLGITAERTEFGTKVIVPARLKGKGVYVNGQAVI